MTSLKRILSMCGKTSTKWRTKLWSATKSATKQTRSSLRSKSKKHRRTLPCLSRHSSHNCAQNVKSTSPKSLITSSTEFKSWLRMSKYFTRCLSTKTESNRRSCSARMLPRRLASRSTLSLKWWSRIARVPLVASSLKDSNSLANLCLSPKFQARSENCHSLKCRHCRNSSRMTRRLIRCSMQWLTSWTGSNFRLKTLTRKLTHRPKCSSGSQTKQKRQGKVLRRKILGCLIC